MHFVNGKSTSKTQFVKNIYIIVCIIISIITKVKRKRCHRYCTLHSPQTWRNKQTETNRQTDREEEEESESGTEPQNGPPPLTSKKTLKYW